jgi:hypothetical protein
MRLPSVSIAIVATALGVAALLATPRARADEQSGFTASARFAWGNEYRASYIGVLAGSAGHALDRHLALGGELEYVSQPAFDDCRFTASCYSPRISLRPYVEARAPSRFVVGYLRLGVGLAVTLPNAETPQKRELAPDLSLAGGAYLRLGAVGLGPYVAYSWAALHDSTSVVSLGLQLAWLHDWVGV